MTFLTPLRWYRRKWCARSVYSSKECLPDRKWLLARATSCIEVYSQMDPKETFGVSKEDAKWLRTRTKSA